MAINISPTQFKVSEIRGIIGELHDIRKRPFHFASVDLNKWMDTKLERISRLIDEVEIEISSEMPDEQRVLNFENEKSIEESAIV